MSWYAELRMVSMVSPKGSDANGTQAIASRMATRRGILHGLLAGLLARGAREPGNKRVARLLARTAPSAEGGKCEKFKTTQTFDGTEQHKKWLTSARL